MYRATLALGLFAAVASAAGWGSPQPELARQPRQLSAPTQDERAPCPAGTLPDADVCIPVPEAPETDDGASLAAERNVHRTRAGVLTEYESIPRRPERPKRYGAYRYPVELGEKARLLSGFDLDQPDAYQRRGERLSAVGHGGIDLAAPRGTEVRLVNLEHQQGSADVLYVGPLIGNSVVTRHSVRESGTLREYLVFFGHLQAPASGLARGMVVPEGAVLGYVGDSGSPGAVHLHLEIRQVRANVDSQSLARGELLLNARTIACDPRNLLPLN